MRINTMTKKSNTHKNIYKSAYEFLLKQNGVTPEMIQKHLQSESVKPDDMRIIYKKFCESAQNRQMSTKVIGQSIGGVQNLSKVLFDFTPHLLIQKYNKNEYMKLLDDIIDTLKPSGKVRVTPKSLWPLYCQSILDSAYYLSQFPTASDFYNWADSLAKDPKSKLALPLLLSVEISGIGFPLASDILKELGYHEFGKPDIHLKDIFKALHIINPNEKSATKQDFETFKAIDFIAIQNDVTPYAVDKIFWLLGSGNFYLSDLKIGNKKKEFISFVIVRE